MILYRGQRADEELGEWWTTSRDEAHGYAQGRGLRSWIIIRIEVSGRWAQQFKFEGTSYRIPHPHLREQVLKAEVVAGRIDVPRTARKPRRQFPNG